VPRDGGNCEPHLLHAPLYARRNRSGFSVFVFTPLVEVHEAEVAPSSGGRGFALHVLHAAEAIARERDVSKRDVGGAIRLLRLDGV
jgi:ribosomal protein S18 acetylase RimI-like enzyme